MPEQRDLAFDPGRRERVGSEEERDERGGADREKTGAEELAGVEGCGRTELVPTAGEVPGDEGEARDQSPAKPPPGVLCPAKSR